LVHGAGSWTLGAEDDAAGDLLLLEGIGLAGFFAGGATIVLSGAARSLIGPAIALTAMGGGLFATTWLLDVYHVSLPKAQRGTERGQRDGTRSSLEYVFIQSPQFDYGPMLRHSASLLNQRWHMAYEAAHAPAGGFAQLRLDLGYRPWQPELASTGNFLELGVAGLSTQQLADDLHTRGLEASVRLRVDSRNLCERIDGAFTEFQVGAVASRTHFFATEGAPAVDFDETVLIARSALGVYLGDPWRRGGELQLYYDHRHDGLAEGMLAAGLGSGALGHFGMLAEYFLGSRLGVRASTEIGSAWIVALGLSMRSEQ
jgi:hypothetical protein